MSLSNFQKHWNGRRLVITQSDCERCLMPDAYCLMPIPTKNAFPPNYGTKDDASAVPPAFAGTPAHSSDLNAIPTADPTQTGTNAQPFKPAAPGRRPLSRGRCSQLPHPLWTRFRDTDKPINACLCSEREQYSTSRPHLQGFSSEKREQIRKAETGEIPLATLQTMRYNRKWIGRTGPPTVYRRERMFQT